MNIHFPGKVIIVAGGTGGLGRAVSRAFLHEGATVHVPYHRESEYAALRETAGHHASALHGHRVDINDEFGVAQFISEVLSRHTHLDAVINTIGGYAGGIKLWDLDTRTFDAQLSINLRSGFILARAAVPTLVRQGHGSFIKVVSRAALDHAAGASAYVASKAAALALIDSLAADTRGTGVRVNSILPSIIDTPANRAAMPNADFSTWPKPEDIAKVILFLASPASNAIHGAAIPVYGNA